MKRADSISVAVRTTASREIGFGHLRRCMTLATELASRGASVSFWLTGDDRGVEEAAAMGFAALALGPGPEPARTLALVERDAPRIVIVDDYAVDEAFFRALRGHGVTVLAVDDLADRVLEVDVVLNGNMNGPSLPYRAPGARLLLGPRYAMLRDGFRAVPPREIAPRPNRVLVTMGGADPLDLTAGAMRAVAAAVPDARIDVVVGPLFRADVDVPSAKATLHRSPPDLAALMREADLAVSAGGQTLYELAACGVPTIAVRVAENQRGNLAALAAAPTLVAAEPTEESIRIAVGRLTGDRALRRTLSDTGRREVDGLGVVRVADALLEAADAEAPVADLRIKSRAVGEGQPVYFIAEAGSNHDGSLDQAKKLIDVAKAAGADAVKFQTFRADALYPKRAGMTDYLKVPKSIYDIIRSLEMPLEWIPQLAEYCAKTGIDFLSTPFDEASADALDPFMPAFKIASYEMTHEGLVQHCARKGKLMIVSTGTADLAEVGETVAAVRAVGNEQLVLLQCTAKYPAPLHALNLRAMETMGRAFRVPVGLSDHSREPLAAPMAAVAMGATVIEKHFTLRNDLPGPDHAYALEPHELTELIRRVREVEKSLGSGLKAHHPEEAELRAFARRSIFTTRAVKRGEVLGPHNLAVLRCGKLPYGMHPRELMRVTGRVAARDLGEEDTLRADDVGALGLARGTVSLRPIEAEDTDRILAWRADPVVDAQMFSEGPPSRSDHEAWLANLRLRTDRLWYVILEDGKPVGNISLTAIDFGAKRAEYGVLLGEPSARGKGIAEEASRIVLDLAFGALGLERVGLELFEDNAAARKLYDRLGFQPNTQSGPPVERRKSGRMRPTLRMRLGRDDWDARR